MLFINHKNSLFLSFITQQNQLKTRFLSLFVLIEYTFFDFSFMRFELFSIFFSFSNKFNLFLVLYQIQSKCSVLDKHRLAHLQQQVALHGQSMHTMVIFLYLINVTIFLDPIQWPFIKSLLGFGVGIFLARKISEEWVLADVATAAIPSSP